MTKFNNKYRIDSTRLPNWNYSGTGKYFITICTRFNEKHFGEIINGVMNLNELGKEVERQWQLTPGIRPDMNISLDTFQIMPNHFHGIIDIGWNKYNNLKLFSNSIHYGESVGRIFDNREKIYYPNCERNNIVCRDTMHCVSTDNDETPCKPKSMHWISTAKNDSTSNETKVVFKNIFGPQRKSLGSVMRGFKSSVTTYARKNEIPFNWHPKYFDIIIRDEVALNKIRNYIRNNPAKWEKDRFRK